MLIKIRRTTDLPLPVYHTTGSAGFDLAANIPVDEFIVIFPHTQEVFDTGLSFEIPEGYMLQIRDRSSMAKNGIIVAGGICDADYRGIVKVILINTTNELKIIVHGDRIAQGIITPVIRVEFEEVDELSNTERSTGHFGSTGV